ncbi:MAG: exosome complex protein Rrp42 [Candidatus Heimdallarchaeota archaeon]|nr:exosome complex protein Rrp42 [Candidatus Heimdallarchaeota archaeon]
MGDNYIISEIEKDHMLSLLEQNKRIDGRTYNTFREVKIETNLVEKAEGSAIVTIGDTKLIVGVKAILGSPFPDTPESGVITTSAELSPIASPYFESGPPSEDSIELARVTDRTIRESHCIDLSKLCIVPEKHVWILFIDFYVLNHDGNLFDAAVLGAIAALATTKIPKVKVLEDGFVEKLEEKESLKIDHYPVAVTCYKLDKYKIYDANFKEDRCSDSRITIGFDEEDHIVALQKGKQGTYKPAEIMEIVHESLNISKTLRKELMKSLS